MQVGKYGSHHQSQYIQIKRLRTAINDLEYFIQEGEKVELLNQEANSRENKTLHKRLEVANKTIEKEVIYNNQVTKDLRLLEERITMLVDEKHILEEELRLANIKITKLQNYKNKKRIAFRRWLKVRLKK